MRDVTVRPMTADDVAEVAEFHLRTVLFAYADIFPPDAPRPTIDQLDRDWRTEPGHSWLAVGDRVIGTVVVRGGEVRRLLVDPEIWQQGVGRRLLGVAVDAIAAARHRSAELWVLEQNSRARRFYEALGWINVPGQVLVHPGGVRELRYRLEIDDQLPET